MCGNWQHLLAQVVKNATRPHHNMSSMKIYHTSSWDAGNGNATKNICTDLRGYKVMNQLRITKQLVEASELHFAKYFSMSKDELMPYGLQHFTHI